MTNRQPERCMMIEAQLITGLPKRTLQQLAAAGRIPGASKPAGRWLFRIDQLHAWAERRPMPSAPRSSGVHPVRRAKPIDQVEAAYEQVLARRKPANVRRR